MRCFPWLLISPSHQPHGVGGIVTSILQTRKLRRREFKQFAKVTQPVKWQSWDLNPVALSGPTAGPLTNLLLVLIWWELLCMSGEQAAS